ncbi:MAG: zf-HC2 domain-containing protein [Abditibacteriota bacterium]|nr:zf-HC2 domain-containing protein [Abditibacteriota bacterium]
MKCRYSRLLGRYADRELKQAEYDAMTRHIESCDECRELLSDILRADSLAAALTTEPCSVSFADLQPRLRRTPSFPVPRWGIVAASLVMLSLGIVFGAELSDVNSGDTDTSYVLLASDRTANSGFVYNFSEE